MPISKDSPHKTAEPLPLRPHHLLCTEFFKGYGYSDGFSANMSEVISMLNADDPAVTLTAAVGAIPAKRSADTTLQYWNCCGFARAILRYGRN